MADTFLHLNMTPYRHGWSVALACLAWLGCTKTSSQPSSEPASAQAQSTPGAETDSSQKPEHPSTALQAGGDSAANQAGSASPASFRALAHDEAGRLVKPSLQPDETLAHQVFRGPFGPASDTLLAIVDRKGEVHAIALIPGKDGRTWQRIDLPAISEGSLDSVPAVFFIDADDRAGPEAVIMTRQMTGAGPEGAIPRPFNAVLSWTGSEFVRLGSIEETVFDLETAAEIKKAIQSRKTSQ